MRLQGLYAGRWSHKEDRVLSPKVDIFTTILSAIAAKSLSSPDPGNSNTQARPKAQQSTSSLHPDKTRFPQPCLLL